jgi:signal transduction histidine kinase
VRRQLAFVMAATTSLVVLSLLIPLGKAVSTIPRDRAISEAQMVSQSLIQTIVAVHDRTRLQKLIEQTSDLNNRTVSVLMPDGKMLGEPFEPSAGVALAQSGQALTNKIAGGIEVLTPAVVENGQTAVVRVAVGDESLTRGVRSALAVLGGLGLMLIVVAVAVADRLARSIVKSIDGLAVTTRALAQGDLDARVQTSGPPEVREVGDTLNLLAERIEELLVTEREAVADLSHRLRTPITALRLNAEGLSDPSESARFTADIDELTKALDRLIRSAREPMQRATSCEVVSVLRDRTGFWTPLAEEQDRTLRAEFPVESVWIGVSAEQLSAALDALIGNIFAHTNEGVAFAVNGTVTRTRVRIDVTDEGCGFRSGAETRGVSFSGSTGLGLSIAAGGSLTIGSSANGGAQVTLEFPILRRT